MKIALIVVASLVALVAVIFVIGSFLPREHSVTSEIRINHSVDTVYKVLRDIGKIPTWWKDVKKSERVDGVPSERWRQEAAGMTMELDVTDIAPPFRFTTRIVEEKGAPFGGTWTYVLNPANEGTTVSITESGWVGPAPFRVMSHVMGLHRTMDGMLGALAAHFGETTKPTHK